MATVPNVTLNDGRQMPQLGYGVYQVPPGQTTEVVRAALDAGYRSIDTATLYRNEAEVGKAIAESGVPREQIFVTTKLWNDRQGYDEALRGFDASLAELGFDYVDLYLIHWPVPSADLYVETWRAFERLRNEGRARSIGVSNFTDEHLRRLLTETDTVPAVNQVELHPLLAQASLRAFDAQHGIATEAWAPLAKGGELLQDPTVTSLADKHGKAPAQVVLRWHLQHGTIVIPKSVTPARIVANIDVFDFELTADDMAAIDRLDAGGRTGPHPDTLGG
ncbi:MAG: aldo/keto reductase [Streptosporangiales bacterium]